MHPSTHFQAPQKLVSNGQSNSVWVKAVEGSRTIKHGYPKTPSVCCCHPPSETGEKGKEDKERVFVFFRGMADLWTWVLRIVNVRSAQWRPWAFHKFKRMPLAMFDELINCATHSLEPGGNSGSSLAPLGTSGQLREHAVYTHNSISKVVREVCETILEEYLDDLLEHWTRMAPWQWVENVEL